MTSRPEVFRREAERNSAGTNVFRYPSKPYPHSMLLLFKEFSYEAGYAQNEYATGSNGSGGLLSTISDSTGRRSSGVGIRGGRSIELPFPKQLQDSSNITLNGISRDPLIEQATNYLNRVAMGGEGTLGNLPSSIQNAGMKLAQMAKGGSGDGFSLQQVARDLGATTNKDAALIARYLLQQVSPLIGDVGQSINLAAGQTLNPKETLVFEGVQLRSHQFSWDLYPENAQDSDQINSIVNVIKRSTLPQTVNFQAAGFDFNRAFLKFPHVVYTYLIGVDAGSFMKFKPAMVTNFTVEYGAGGTMALLKGGKPAGVTLSLSMQELAIETAEDYGEPALAANDGIVSDTDVQTAASVQDNITSASAG